MSFSDKEVSPVQHAWEILKHDDETLGGQIQPEFLFPEELQVVWEDAETITRAIDAAIDGNVQYLTET